MNCDNRPHPAGEGETYEEYISSEDVVFAALRTIEHMRQVICEIFEHPANPTSGEKPSQLLADGGENERLSASRQELRKEALASHDEWAEKVLQSVNGSLNTLDQEHEARNLPTRQRDGNKKKEMESDSPRTPTPQYSSRSTVSAKVATQTILWSLLSLGGYDARSRTFLLKVASSLRIPVSLVISQESETAHTLIATSKRISADEEAKKRSDESKFSRRWKVGLASVAGAAVIGVTGGLAAPFVAAGIGTLMGGIGLGATAAAGVLGAMAGSGVIVGTLFGAYGGMMTGEMVQRYAAEVEDFAFIPVRNMRNRLRVTVGITGWLTAPEEVVLPWKSLNSNAEVYALRWEMDAIMDLGSSLETLLGSYAMSFAGYEVIKRTVLVSLMTALWPISLVKAARVIDNPFSIAKHRSEKAGRVLADVIINKAQGERPITLVGFSLGARVVYFCLLELAQRAAYGLVENVVFMGAPIPSSGEGWEAIRSVVAGRVVNVFSEKDYILGFLYRTSSVQLGVAGLQAVRIPGVENMDVGGRVEGHLRYRHMVGVIMRDVFGEDVKADVVEKDEEVLRGLEQKQKEGKETQKDGESDLEAQIDSAVEKAEKELEDRRRNRGVGQQQLKSKDS